MAVTKYFVDKQGNYIGAFERPDEASWEDLKDLVEVHAAPPVSALQKWLENEWKPLEVSSNAETNVVT